jgi:hypothetical protein
LVACARPTSSLPAQRDQKRPDHVRVEHGVIELVDGTLTQERRMFEEHFQGVTISKHRVAARLPLDGQMLLEEVLDQRG